VARSASIRCIACLVVALVLAVPAAASAAPTPAGSTILVSRPDGLAPAPLALDNSSSPSVVSADGRYVAFSTQADGIAPGADPRFDSVAVRDTQTNTTTLAGVSDGADGVAANADATALAVGVEPGSLALDPPADQPHLLVVFSSGATNLVDHATGQPAGTSAAEVWLRDVTAGRTYLVSRLDGPTGQAGDQDSDQAAMVIGPGGPMIAFRSRAENLPGGVVGTIRTGIFLREVDQGTTLYLACRVHCDGPSTSFFTDPSIAISDSSPTTNAFCPTATPEKCLEVAFATDDSSLTADPAGGEQVVVAVSVLDDHGVPTGFNQFRTMSEVPGINGNPPTFANDLTRQPSLSGDGLTIGYITRAKNLLLSPPQLVRDYAVIEFSNGFMQLALRNSAGAGANSDADAISVGGTTLSNLHYVVATASTNFGVSEPTNGILFDHAYLATLSPTTAQVQAGQLIDHAPDGTPGDQDVASVPGPQISADGSTVAFDSRSTNLGGGRRFERSYVSRGPATAPVLVSRPSGTDAFPTGIVSSTIGARDNHIALRVVSADGRYVAFSSTSSGLAPGENDTVIGVFVRDNVAGTTTLVSRATGADGVAADQDSQLDGISDNGRRVMFTTAATNLDADNRALDRVYVRDLDANTTTTVSRQTGAGGAVVSGEGIGLSGDGDSALFDSLTPIDPDIPVATVVDHLYVRRLSTNTTTLVDREDGAHGTVAESSVDEAAIDGDGNRIVWTTSAFFAGISPFPPTELAYMRDLQTNTTSLVSRASGATGAIPNAPVTVPAISGNGQVVAFASAATNLGAAVTSSQLWVRNLTGDQTTQLASRGTGADGTIPNNISVGPVLDETGDRLVFTTFANNLDGPGLLPGIYGSIRDLPSQTTDVVNRANGTGTPDDLPGGTTVSISASGNCAAFSSGGLNLGDGFPSSDFAAVRLRVLSGECDATPNPAPPPVALNNPPPVTVEPTAPKGATHPRPAVSHLRLQPSHFRVHGRHRGTTISFTLNRAVRVTLRFERLRSGRRNGKHCVAGAHHGKRCTIVHRAGSLTRSAHGGTNKIRFSGTLNHHALPRGSYRLTATPLGGRAATARFGVR
jgi:hypothetical protein